MDSKNFGNTSSMAGIFCKELAGILQERSDLEVSYAKSLQKLSAKLLRASKEGLGSVNQAWQMVGAEMEYEAGVHKSLAVCYNEELVKPLKGLLDTQHKVRKSVETMVDKTAKSLAEWRSAEAKAKRAAYTCARDNERAEEQALEARLGRGRPASEKEASKNKDTTSLKYLILWDQSEINAPVLTLSLPAEDIKMFQTAPIEVIDLPVHGQGVERCVKEVETRRQKTENAMAKADTDYYNFCLRGERARLEWETAVNKGTQCFRALEEERLMRLRTVLYAYHHSTAALAPKMAQSSERLSEPVACADVERDVQTLIQVKGADQTLPEQLLPDFYAEDMTNAMNRDRRKKALDQFLQLIRQDVARERRGKNGVENLARAMQDTPHFSNEGSQKDVREKLQHMRSMLAYLEASRYKMQVSLAELEGQPRPQHPLSKHIEHHKDRQGMTQSILKVPVWVRLEPVDVTTESTPEDSPHWSADRGKADGTSNQPDSDFDEFSSGERSSPGPPVVLTTFRPPPVPTEPEPANGSTHSSESEPAATSPDLADSKSSEVAPPSPSPADPPPSPPPAGQTPSAGSCRVLYDYTANMNDELTIKTGDEISVHDKQEDGWWLGELNGTIGIFPASYVEERT